MSVDPSKTNYAEYADDESSSSSEEEGRFGFWGAGVSSGSLSKYMAKREKDSKKDLQKELAAKREADLVKEKAEIAKVEAAKAEAAKASLKLEEQKKSSGSQTLASNIGWSQNQAASSQTFSSQPIQAIQPAQAQPPNTSYGSHADLLAERITSSNQSREQIYNVEEPKRSGNVLADNSAFNNAMIAAYVTQAMNNVSAAVPFANRVIPREEFDAEPELLDSIPASKILRRLGAYRNWSDQEIQSDLNVLEFHRLRSVKDLRELSLDSWKEIKELLPLVKELLIKEVHKGRSAAFVRPEVPLQNVSGNSSFSVTETPQEIKTIRAPTSTPMDSPDLSQSRRAIQGRQW